MEEVYIQGRWTCVNMFFAFHSFYHLCLQASRKGGHLVDWGAGLCIKKVETQSKECYMRDLNGIYYNGACC